MATRPPSPDRRPVVSMSPPRNEWPYAFDVIREHRRAQHQHQIARAPAQQRSSRGQRPESRQTSDDLPESCSAPTSGSPTPMPHAVQQARWFSVPGVVASHGSADDNRRPTSVAQCLCCLSQQIRIATNRSTHSPPGQGLALTIQSSTGIETNVGPQGGCIAV